MSLQFKKLIGSCLSTCFVMAQFGSVGMASVLDMNPEDMKDIVTIAKAINVVQPQLKDSKYLEYAVGIHRASKKYEIEPAVLIAIAAKETNFRENLPEGKAGELGIVQIRRMWLKNPQFRAEFKNAALKDLHSPLKSFMYAAWILHDLKDSVSGGSLPYWSYYNSVKFENRFRYFVAVNKHIAALVKHGLKLSLKYMGKSKTISENNTQSIGRKVALLDVELNSRTLPPISERLVPTVRNSAERRNRWIPDALKKVQSEESNRKPDSLVKTALELGVNPTIIPTSTIE